MFEGRTGRVQFLTAPRTNVQESIDGSYAPGKAGFDIH